MTVPLTPSLKGSYSLGAVLLLATLSSCRSPGPSAQAQGSQATPVQIENVATQWVEETEDFVATLESRQSITLKPRVAGQVIGIYAKPGDRVPAGTPIIQIDAREQVASVISQAMGAQSAQADVAGAKADTAKAQADLATAKAQLQTYEADRQAKLADLKLSQQQYERYQKLKVAGAISQDALDQYANTLNVARANLKAVETNIQAQRSNIAAQSAQIDAQYSAAVKAESQVRQAQADTQAQSAKLQYYRIAAPFNGIVGNIPVKEGDFVDTSTNLATLSENNALEVNIPIPIEKSANLKIGTPVELLNSQGQRLATSRIYFVSPSASSDTQSVLAKARVENGSGQLRTDQLIKARVVWQQRPSALVPTVAISRIAGQDFVYIATQSDKGLVAKQIPVSLGVIQGNSYQVLKGLKAGDKVVTSGIIKLSDGAAIKPATAEPSL
ncbi:MAG TPA: efflux RND transporter periplasmic adaptor subunit [Stenomitos sp.]